MNDKEIGLDGSEIVRASNPIEEADIVQRVEDLCWLLDRTGASDGTKQMGLELRHRLWTASYAFDQAIDRAVLLQVAAAERVAQDKESGRIAEDAEFVGANWWLMYPFGTDYPGILEESFYAESCYVQLFRICERVQKGKWSVLLPELKKFKPPLVSDTRNWDFEHLDHNRPRSMSSNPEDGLTMFPGDKSKKRSDSSPLRINVEEFVDDLQDRIERAIARLEEDELSQQLQLDE